MTKLMIGSELQGMKLHLNSASSIGRQQIWDIIRKEDNERIGSLNFFERELYGIGDSVAMYVSIHPTEAEADDANPFLRKLVKTHKTSNNEGVRDMLKEIEKNIYFGAKQNAVIVKNEVADEQENDVTVRSFEEGIAKFEEYIAKYQKDYQTFIEDHCEKPAYDTGIERWTIEINDRAMKNFYFCVKMQ